MYSRVKRNQMNKVNKYSIRKSSFGAVSVAVAALMVFGTYSNVSADEQKVDSHRTEKEEQKVSEKPEETKQEKSEEIFNSSSSSFGKRRIRCQCPSKEGSRV